MPTGDSAREIAASVEQAITDGELDGGATLPTVRSVASNLGVSPATVNSAYQMLRRRALIVSEGTRGLRVSQRPPLPTRPALIVPDGVVDLCNGNPDPALLPELRWALEGEELQPQLYGRPTAFGPLLEHAATDFAASGIDPAAMTVVSGALDGIDRLLSASLRPGDGVIVEDPTYAELLDLLHAMGLTPVGVPLDDEGPVVDDFAAALARARAVVLTTRSHNPTGTTVTPSRAEALRRTLSGHPDVLAIDNDYSAVVADTAHAPITTGHRRWAVVRSLSKALGPDLRIAIVTGDALTIAQVDGRQRISAGWVSHILQQITHRLWTDPRTAERIELARTTYADRRRALIDALATHGIRGRGGSGLNVYIEVSREGAVAQALLTHGWAVRPGEGYRLDTRQPFIRVTTAALDEQDAHRFAIDLATVLSGDNTSKPG